jgi:hypothetical protein
MNRLNKRVEKLELMCAPDRVWIRYIVADTDSDAGKEIAKAKAINEWEAKNGLLGEVEPDFLVWCTVSRPARSSSSRVFGLMSTLKATPVQGR